MNIQELKASQPFDFVQGKVISKEAPRSFQKFGKEGRVCNGFMEDSTGTVKFTLWNDHIDIVSEGDTIRIENGYTSEWQGNIQVSTGKNGELAVMPAPTTDEDEFLVAKEDMIDIEDEEL